MNISAGLRFAVAAALCLFMPVTATADTPQVSLQGGVSYMGRYFWANQGTPAVFVQVVFDAHAIGQSEFTWAPELMAGWINGRDFDRFDQRRYTASDHIWLIGGGVRLQYGPEGAWYRHLFFSFQPVLHTGRTPALSSSYEFSSTIGWQARRWMLGIRHISNGSLEGPNLGETMLVAGYNF